MQAAIFVKRRSLKNMSKRRVAVAGILSAILTLSLIGPAAAARVYNADTNKSGFLEADELAKLPFPETVQEADRNGDGKVSLQEFVRIRFIQFSEADSNDDGELSLDEVITVYQGRKAQ